MAQVIEIKSGLFGRRTIAAITLVIVAAITVTMFLVIPYPELRLALRELPLWLGLGAWVLLAVCRWLDLVFDGDEKSIPLAAFFTVGALISTGMFSETTLAWALWANLCVWALILIRVLWAFPHECKKWIIS